MSSSSTERWHGPLLVVSGPSAAGKTTVCAELAKDPRFQVAVTATTRSPREGEKDGVAYHFLSRERFEEMLVRDEFLEHAEFFGNRYGTPRVSVEGPSRAGKIPVLNIDIIGAKTLRTKKILGLYLFLRPGDLGELKKRLIRRGADSRDAARRILRFEEEMAHASGYDAVVENWEGRLGETVSAVRSLVFASPHFRHLAAT